MSIWSTRDKRRYLAIPDTDQTSVFQINGAGSPGNGSAKFTFSDGATATVAANGWTVTSLDKIHNKNELYGTVSSKRNLPPSECKLMAGKGKVTRSFNVPAQ